MNNGDIQLQLELDRLEEKPWDELTRAEQQRSIELYDALCNEYDDDGGSGSLLPAESSQYVLGR